MTDRFAWKLQQPENGPVPEAYREKNAAAVNAFHRKLPGYAPTPLRRLNGLAAELGVRNVYVKDESFRFGLNAFKVLGASYAVARQIAEAGGREFDALTFAEMREAAAAMPELTLITATDGNHGRGVAWVANRLGRPAVVYMPKGTAAERLENILALGADATITDLRYDDAVRLAADRAAEKGWLLVQDTAWEGYTGIPGRIMEGYTTMGLEISRELAAENGPAPTHIFLQAGVGSMAAALAAYFRAVYGPRPVITVVEPNRADCFYRSALAGRPVAVTEEMNTIMAGLACGVPSPLAWEILRAAANCFVSMPDACAARGMRVLGAPIGEDARIISGESGASGLGCACELLLNASLRGLKDELGLTEGSNVLCISTEGATDRANYRRIVRDGAYPNES